jgi:hypothetical protein
MKREIFIIIFLLTLICLSSNEIIKKGILNAEIQYLSEPYKTIDLKVVSYKDQCGYQIENFMVLSYDFNSTVYKLNRIFTWSIYAITDLKEVIRVFDNIYVTANISYGFLYLVFNLNELKTSPLKSFTLKIAIDELNKS